VDPDEEVPQGTWANLPEGHQVMTDNPWNTREGGGWIYWDATGYGDVRIAQDAGETVSPSSVLERVYTTDMPDGYQPGSSNYFLENSREIYVGYNWKASNNWQQHPLGVKFAVILFQSGNIYMDWRTADDGLMIVTQGWGQGVYEPNVNPAASKSPANGVWQKVEMYLKYNDPGQQNGIIRWWIGGVLAGNYTNVVFPSGGLNTFVHAGTWGGGCGCSPPNEQSLFIGHTIITRPAQGG
jgi:hypothetical protein